MSYKDYKEDKYIVRKFSGGEKLWFYKEKYHREDGPAYEEPSGYKEWWLNSEEYPEEDWKKEMRKRKLKELGI